MFAPPPFNPELPCEVLAENTFEALRVVRQGDWVYKFLRPHDSFPGQTAEARRRQILLRVQESHKHRELNPLAYDERRNCLVSRYINGRMAKTSEARELYRSFVFGGRGYLTDVTVENCRMSARGLVLIDFSLSSNAPVSTTSPLATQGDRNATPS